MARLSREVVITEKIDGTNAQVFIEYTLDDPTGDDTLLWRRFDGLSAGGVLTMRVGSRTRWLTRQADNFGFAKWVQENAEALIGLGQGRHFGEWWGSGIQRGYGLTEKRFSLFNVSRWIDPHTNYGGIPTAPQEFAPACCHVVPILGRFEMNTNAVNAAVRQLSEQGSSAAPGFMKPEGVVVWHTAGNVGFKKTIEKDDQPKSK